MAEFICLAMASQYTENNSLESSQQQNNTTTSSFRRTLGTSTLFVEENQLIPNVHIRIVPSIENPSRSLIFNIIERDLEMGRVIKIGRFTDRSSVQNHISFKIWLNNEGKIQLKDTKSSSGTFVNHVRLSPANTESRAVEIRDGDLVQLGVDYQGGYEEIYRSVRMRFEVNRPQQSCPLSYSLSVFNNLRSLTHVSTAEKNDNEIEVEECCICLYALAPFQALFVAPCSHSYHFKCIRPLFDSYPGFQCPICRTYSDLDASVAIETEEVIEKLGLQKKKSLPDDTRPSNCISEPPLSTTLVTSSTSLSGLSDIEDQQASQETRNRRATIVLEDHHMSDDQDEAVTRIPSTSKQSHTTNHNFVEKIKTVFSSEKQRAHKSFMIKKNHAPEDTKVEGTHPPLLSDTLSTPSSYSSSSSRPTALQPVLSRQSTYYNSLNGILEECVTARVTLSEHSSS
ncbi:uncharacterized protein BX663DRAFT_518773 [Cokeromyces recurvatus]|uniref:uncharacterized protein n=1 Tax=Cokeromyces recurvatus TaxID=90255 RepID=UPI00221E93BF|nr:uncharacterized protein BX663DRAFT_522402 [Cokeromyces recurvatus]XP_051380137.1 uncharacterized protein BX663DRAFT_518773 [Cokeromyces recurvatus]KAI7899132.1 hypothetical protein BX663DRAFT_522402 [Cokeromyces recurvatus]KAI7900152.1 hypothetical protein BX663DRAFT_518773 [Cokeromyces recurvatus]